jgi:thioredoxin reductase (NADPH)
MAAGVYGSSEGLRVLIVERCAAGGQAGTSSRIENYLGFPEGISGEDLTGRGFKQATRFGAEVALTRSVEKLTPSSEGYVCEFDGGQSVSARAVVLATGVDWRRLQAKGEDRLLGHGIFYGAARQEATNVVGKKVFIVGGGNSGSEIQAIHLVPMGAATVLGSCAIRSRTTAFCASHLAGVTDCV